MFKKLLVPLDGSPLAERALPYAVALARATQGQLVLVRVTEHPSLSDDPDAEKDAQAYLQTALDKVRQEGLLIEPRVHHRYLESVGQAILLAVRDQQAEAIVLSTHGRSGLGRWVYGSVADEVLRGADVPVLLVSAVSRRVWPTDRGLRILVPLDGSTLAEEVLGTAAPLAERAGGELVLLQAVELPTYLYDGIGYAYPAHELDLLRDDAVQYLEGLADKLRSTGKRVSVVAEIGFAASTIADVAREQDIDLIAMATHGRSGLARLVLGSVATATLHQATVPILLTRPAAMRHREEEASSA